MNPGRDVVVIIQPPKMQSCWYPMKVNHDDDDDDDDKDFDSYNTNIHNN